MIKSKYNIIKITEAKPKIWLISFADLLSLILCFFIMSYATLTLPKKDWSEYSGKILNYINGKGDKVLFSSIEFNKPLFFQKNKRSPNNNLSYAKVILENELKQVINDNSKYSITENKNFVKLNIDASIFLKRNKNNYKLALTKNGNEILLSLIKIIKTLPNQIEISYINPDDFFSLQMSDFISGKLQKSGYEYDIIKLLPSNFNPDKIIENTIVLIIKPYEVDI